MVAPSLSDRRPLVASPASSIVAITALTLAACAADDVSLGGAGTSAPQAGACGRGARGVVEGDVLVTSQAELDELAGCREITGGLEIRATGAASLVPLASLRLVRGTLLINGLAPTSSLDSLEGLEALERVGELQLLGLEITSLAPLQNLRQVRQDPLANTAILPTSTLSIDGCHQLIELTGLENLTDWDGVRLTQVPALESLRGLVASRNGQRLVIRAAPSLRELASLGGRGRLELIAIADTGLESFQPEDVLLVRRLELVDNAALVDAEGLRAISSLEELLLVNNDRLERLPEFPHLRVGLTHLTIRDNDALRSIPAWSAPDDGDFVPPEYADPAEAPDYFYPPEFSMAEIMNNAQLRDLALPTIFRFGGRVRIHDNPRLQSADLSFLDSADSLSLVNNPALTQVHVAALHSVDELQVIDNPSFSAAVFENVRTFSSEMQNNQGLPVP